MTTRTPLESFLAALAFGLSAPRDSASQTQSAPKQIVIDTNVDSSLRFAPRSGRQPARRTTPSFSHGLSK